MEWLDYYNEGFTDADIARKTGIKRPTIQYRRSRLGLPSNFSYKDTRKIDYDEVKLMLVKGRTVKINLIREKLLNYGIETTIQIGCIIYIRAKSRERFFNLIKPYVCKSMLYKVS